MISFTLMNVWPPKGGKDLESWTNQMKTLRPLRILARFATAREFIIDLFFFFFFFFWGGGEGGGLISFFIMSKIAGKTAILQGEFRCWSSQQSQKQ